MVGKWLLKGLIIIVLILLSTVLTIITVNGIYRCYNYIKTTKPQLINDYLIVDLYASSLNSIPIQASPGMTVLIDLGIHNLDTGVYIVQNEQKDLLKLKVPEPNEKYKITKGQFLGYVHTIRPSFLEVRPPSETEIITNASQQHDIKSDTKSIIVSPSITTSAIINLPGVLTSDFRRIKVANLSSFKCILNTIHSKYELDPFFIGDVFFAMKDEQIHLFS